MHKTLSTAAVAVIACSALAAPATAFAADTSPRPAPSGSSATAAPSAELHLSKAAADAGDSIRVTVTTSGSASQVDVSSSALQNVVMQKSGAAQWTGTAKVADVKAGDYGVAAVAVIDGKPVRSTVNLTVVPRTEPIPAPVSDSLTLSSDHGAPGSRIQVTVNGPKEHASLSSSAFGGTVNLHQDTSKAGVWHGTATVANNAKPGSYAVAAYDGRTRFDTAKFSVTAGGRHDGTVTHKPVKHTLTPGGQQLTPKGPVDTGMAAEAQHGPGTGAALMGAGLVGAGLAAAGAAGALHRRRNRG